MTTFKFLIAMMHICACTGHAEVHPLSSLRHEQAKVALSESASYFANGTFLSSTYIMLLDCAVEFWRSTCMQCDCWILQVTLFISM